MGTEEPVHFQGVECGTRIVHHNTLATFVLRNLRPEKFNKPVGRDAVEVTTQEEERAIEMAVTIKAAMVDIEQANGLSPTRSAPDEGTGEAS